MTQPCYGLDRCVGIHTWYKLCGVSSFVRDRLKGVAGQGGDELRPHLAGQGVLEGLHRVLRAL